MNILITWIILLVGSLSTKDAKLFEKIIYISVACDDIISDTLNVRDECVKFQEFVLKKNRRVNNQIIYLMVIKI